MLVWEEFPAISFKVSESFKAFKNWHPSHLVSLCLLPISLLLFSGSGKLNWLGWNFLSVLPCQAQGWEQNKSSGSATAVFVFIVSRAGWWRGFQLLSQIFSGCGTVFPHKIYIGLSTDIILLISHGTGWGSTQHLLPLLPFNLWNQHLLQPFPVLFYGTLSGC